MGSTDQALATTDSVVFSQGTFENIIVDSTGTEALLVRKDSDGGDVLAVDTTNDRVLLGPGAPVSDIGL